MKNCYARTLFTILFIGSSVSTASGFCIDESGCFGGLADGVTFLAAITLIVMAVCALELIAERWLRLTIARRQSTAFQSKVAEALYFNRVEEAIFISGMYPQSPVACVVNRCLQNNSPAYGSRAKALSPSLTERERAIFLQTCEIKRRLWALAAIGWTTPLLGLFFATSRTAEELLSFSLIVAVPAIWAHRYFSAQVEIFVLEMDKLSLPIIEQFTDREEKPIRTLPIPRYATQPLDGRPTPQTSR